MFICQKTRVFLCLLDFYFSYDLWLLFVCWGGGKGCFSKVPAGTESLEGTFVRLEWKLSPRLNDWCAGKTILILRLVTMKYCGSKLLDALLSNLPHVVQAVGFQVQRWSYQFSILVMYSCRHVIYFFWNLNGDIHLTEKTDERKRKGITQTREICAEWVLIRLCEIACVFCDWAWHYLWNRV